MVAMRPTAKLLLDTCYYKCKDWSNTRYTKRLDGLDTNVQDKLNSLNSLNSRLRDALKRNAAVRSRPNTRYDDDVDRLSQ